MEISTHSHNIMVDDATRIPILSNNGKHVLMCRIADGSLKYVARNVVEEIFGSIITSDPTVAISQANHCSVELQCNNNLSNIHKDASYKEVGNSPEVGDLMETDKERKLWSRNDILQLIAVYKDYSHLFKSQSIRNEKVWKIISEKISKYSTEQVKNKFKYLKAKYIKKKENSSNKASGHDKLVFEYFDEFDELFCSQPNITPVATVASCRKQNSEIEIMEVSTETQNTSTKMATEEEDSITVNKSMTLKGKNVEKRIIGTKLSSQVEKMTEEIKRLREDMNTRERNKERRHAEILQQKHDATNVFKEYIKFLKEKDNI